MLAKELTGKRERIFLFYGNRKNCLPEKQKFAFFSKFFILKVAVVWTHWIGWCLSNRGCLHWLSSARVGNLMLIVCQRKVSNHSVCQQHRYFHTNQTFCVSLNKIDKSTVELPCGIGKCLA